MEQEFLRRIAEALERIADRVEANAMLFDDDPDYPLAHDSEPPAWLKAENVESLAQEMASYVRDNLPEMKLGTWLDDTVTNAYWDEKGLGDKYSLPARAGLLVERVEKRVRQLFQEEAEAAVPGMVSKCLAWAQAHGAKRLTQADVGAILRQEGLDLHHETLRSVWLEVNLQLKS